MWMRRAHILGAREKDSGNWGKRAPTATRVCPDFQHDANWVGTRSGADIEADAEATKATIDYENCIGPSG